MHKGTEEEEKLELVGEGGGSDTGKERKGNIYSSNLGISVKVVLYLSKVMRMSFRPRLIVIRAISETFAL